MEKRLCSVDGCGSSHKARGLCGLHYQRAKASGQFGSNPCSEPGCSEPRLARGQCKRHYDQMARKSLYPELPRCSVDACERASRAKGMCDAHRRRALRGSAVLGPVGAGARINTRNKGKQCEVPTCDRAAKTLGLCSTHYYRQYTGRELEPTPCVVRGCARWRTGISADGFCAGHDHAARKYGSATEQGHRIGALDRKGYRVIRIAGREVKEHRYVMERLLGRRLRPGETVHHCNTVRDDNRTAGPLDAGFRSGNLELWTRSQPSGGRVVDKVAWAVELLELYAPELLAENPVQLRLA